MTAPPHRPGRGRDSKSDLLDAARAAVEDRGKAAIATAAAAGAPRRRKRRRGALAALGVIGGILVLVQPDWLAGPKAPPAELPAVAAASLRVTMWRERDRVIAYQKQFGQLPATGADAGITTPGLEYQRAGNADFKLQARLGDSVLTLTSADSMRPFLGNSLRQLQTRGRP